MKIKEFPKFLNIIINSLFIKIKYRLLKIIKKKRYFVVTDEYDKQGIFTFTTGVNIYDRPQCILHDTYQDGGFKLVTQKDVFTVLDNCYIREVIFDKDYRKIKDFSPSKKKPYNSLLLGNRMNLYDIHTLNYLITIGSDASLLKNYAKIIVKKIFNDQKKIVLYKFFYKYNVSFFFIDPPYKWSLKIKNGLLIPDKIPSNFDDMYLNIKEYYSKM